MAEEMKKRKYQWLIQAKVGDNPDPPTPAPPPPGSGMNIEIGSIEVRPYRKAKAVTARRVINCPRGYTIKRFGIPKAEAVYRDNNGRKKKR